ncbi:uncharacterized protein E0L32_001935 [Thyridium curvatum]|uniref:MPR-like GPCR protein n=1 Tax=Thyridium curvatum TaxID=1093900 RepID=A0A507AVT3_9PEZI|nr:uncharacterized protein E0L32_001744 [Thyridium curvatum]XP_030990071.1 uncharacterized protein E0L32_001935 [Thyridium curvatum]TPX08169.1 hypothetical protein E0L32_001744 [Thyridium curvatum]TPX08360.1 hypothetical protein E0L32_001935 [Thyridium curvatum]
MAVVPGLCPRIDSGFEPSEPSRTRTGSLEKLRLRLISYEDLPAWYQDNKFLRHGYRSVSDSTKSCFASWFYMHNETINIYSHGIPAIIFLLGEFYICAYLRLKYPQASVGDYLVLACFLLTAAICLGLSTSYHTLMNHSQHVSELWLRLDFVGIIVLILGHFFSGIYVVFWCDMTLRAAYWGMIAALGALSIIVLVLPKFQGLEWRTFRLCCFVGTGFSGLVPIIHGIKAYGINRMIQMSGLPYYFGEGGLFLLGVIIYSTRFPECIKPGMFDIYGSSHQLFHILVVFAMAVHLTGVLIAYDKNYNSQVC